MSSNKLFKISKVRQIARWETGFLLKNLEICPIMRADLKVLLQSYSWQTSLMACQGPVIYKRLVFANDHFFIFFKMSSHLQMTGLSYMSSYFKCLEFPHVQSFQTTGVFIYISSHFKPANVNLNNQCYQIIFNTYLNLFLVH